MSSSHLSSQTPLSPKHAQNSSAVHQEEHSFESAFKNITSSLESLDFNVFFQKFDLDSPVCRYMEAFNPSDLYALITKASPTTSGLPYDSPTVKVAIKAKEALDDQLGYLDALFKDIEAAGLYVGTVRHSLRWLRDVNRRSLERLRSSQKNHGVVSENNRTPLQFRFPSPSAIPLLSWKQQQQRYHDAYKSLMITSRPPQAGRSIQHYPSSPVQPIDSHISSPSYSARSIPVQSPTRVRFSSRGHSVERGEPDVPVMPSPLSPHLSTPNIKASKGRNHKSLSVFIAKP